MVNLNKISEKEFKKHLDTLSIDKILCDSLDGVLGDTLLSYYEKYKNDDEKAKYIVGITLDYIQSGSVDVSQSCKILMNMLLDYFDHKKYSNIRKNNMVLKKYVKSYLKEKLGEKEFNEVWKEMDDFNSELNNKIKEDLQ